MTKKKIRSIILLKLNKQKEEKRDTKSKLIKQKLFRAQAFKKAKVVMFYISFDGEVNTQDMIKEAQKLGKIIAVPVCGKNRRIKPCRLDQHNRLKNGLYGICEPVARRSINLQDIDLVVVPGLAFDKQGNRLGRGKGYYDCFLRQLPKETVSIGLAFDFQILPLVPATDTDVSVRRVIFA